MKVLVVGAGVIGTVYGAHLAAAGEQVSVLSHGPRTDEVADRGLSARDILSGRRVAAKTEVVRNASGVYDVVLVAVRRDQLTSACAGLAVLSGRPAVVFLGVADMDGWLAYHAAFVACIAAALYRCGTDPVRLAADGTVLRLMCRALTEAFAALGELLGR